MLNNVEVGKVADYSSIKKEQIKILMEVLNHYAGFRSTTNLESKLVRVLRNVSDAELSQWVLQLSRNHKHPDLNALVEDLTNHETYFFRDYIQFEFITEKILPYEYKEKARKGKFRIWSAAGASGEEAYSLAILCVEFALENGFAKWKSKDELEFLNGFSVEVLGSDISRQAVRLAKDSVYTNFGLSSFRDMPQKFWRYFEKYDSSHAKRYAQSYEYFRPINAIRNLVKFEQHNLVDKYVGQFGKFDVVVCRNIFIYIDSDKQDLIQKNINQAMFLGAYVLFSAVDRVHDSKSYKEHWYKNSLYFEKKK